MRKTESERFKEKVQIDKSGCWNWMASKNIYGYGQFGRFLAHRFSWSLTNGEIKDGMFVLHRCDNPACVKPDHLFLGSQADNMADMITKGRDNKCTPEKHGSKTHPERIVRGENKPAAKLKASDIPVIRKMIVDGLSHRNIAKQFGISHPQISYIKNRKTWSHIN